MDHLDFPNTVQIALDRLKEIPGVESLPVSERLAGFFFMLLDSIEELHPDAGELSTSFRRDASGFASPFHEALRSALTDVTVAPDVSGVNRIVLDTAPSRFVVAEVLIQLISASLLDESDDRLRSAALADRVLAFAASVLSSPVPEKAVDLVRYAVEAGYLPLDRIPLVADWFGADENS